MRAPVLSVLLALQTACSSDQPKQPSAAEAPKAELDATAAKLEAALDPMSTPKGRLTFIRSGESGEFHYDVPFISESSAPDAHVPGRNAKLVSCSPAAVAMLVRFSTGKDLNFTEFVTEAAKKRDGRWGWTHDGLVGTMGEYEAPAVKVDYGDRKRFSEEDAYAACSSTLRKDLWLCLLDRLILTLENWNQEVGI